MSMGEIKQIVGPVVDVWFPKEALPLVHDALTIEAHQLTLEVQQQIGDGQVRAIALGPTDGLKRGMSVANTRKPISVPVGEATLGRIMNVLGDAIDGKPALDRNTTRAIHQKPPTFAEQLPTTALLETGIKVIDLLCPLAKGGKAGLFGGAGVGKTVNMMELIRNIAVDNS